MKLLDRIVEFTMRDLRMFAAGCIAALVILAIIITCVAGDF